MIRPGARSSFDRRRLLRVGFLGAVSLAGAEIVASVVPFMTVRRIVGLGGKIAVGTRAEILAAFRAGNDSPILFRQGQFFLILYSHGYPGLVFYLGWFAYTLGATFRRRSITDLLWGSVILVSFLEMMVYDFLPMAMYLVMIACALLWRQSRLDAEAAAPAAHAALRVPAAGRIATAK